MNESWKTFSSIVPAGAGNIFAPRSGASLDETWAASWPPTLAPSPWAPGILPVSRVPPGGLLASLGADTSGGILGSLALPWKPFGPNYVGVSAPPPVGAASRPAPDIDQYLSPAPRLLPMWDYDLTRESAGSAQALPGPSGRSSPSAFAGDQNARDWTTRYSDGDPNIISDASPDNKWILNAQYAAEGHHHNPRAVYEKFPLPPGTREVFDKATTGPLPIRRWHENDALHRAYSKAVGELMDRFMQENSIKPEQMTPDQARSLLKAIAEAEDPRIRVYGEMLKRMRMFYRLRSGARGNE